MKNTVLFGLAIFVISCNKKQESTFPTEGKITESIYASGSLKSQDQYQAFVTVNGVIDQIFVSGNRFNEYLGPSSKDQHGKCQLSCKICGCR
jgi:translation elongation factor EF-1alpha